MSAEFTYYALFAMLALTTGVVFQFFLTQLSKMKKDIKKTNESIAKIHQEVYNIKNTKSSTSRSRSNVIPFRRHKKLEGNLELEYQGSKASTRAIFHVDSET